MEMKTINLEVEVTDVAYDKLKPIICKMQELSKIFKNRSIEELPKLREKDAKELEYTRLKLEAQLILEADGMGYLMAWAAVDTLMG